MAATAGTPTRTVLPRGLSYFEYQQLVGRDVLIPWIVRRLELDGKRVGDYGAHHGGMVEALRESRIVQSAVGLELSAAVVSSSPFVADDHFRLEVADVLTLTPGTFEFDLVLLHDVLEHIPDYERALDAVAGTLALGGHLFVSFPPYYSAFGGHQHLARGWARFLPFVHLLPTRIFVRVAEPAANEYMSAQDSLTDMLSVRQTRLTVEKAERAFSRAGFEVVDSEFFLVRPEYTVRYGLRARASGILGRLSGVRELVVNGAFYLLRPSRSTRP